jgi:lipopolysaccharide export system protein LptC
MSSRTEFSVDNTDKLLRAAATRARLAPLLSLAFLAVAFGFLLLFMFQSGFFSAIVPKAKTADIVVQKPEQITGEQSRIAGFDKNQMPYEVTAVSGYQDKTNTDLAHLETVAGKFRKKNGDTIEMLSNTALFDSKSKQLDMKGDVTIRRQGSYTATMDSAHVDVETKDLTSDVPVVVETENATIRANGTKISNDGKTIVFLNGVRARFEQAAKKGDEAP